MARYFWKERTWTWAQILLARSNSKEVSTWIGTLQLTLAKAMLQQKTHVSTNTRAGMPFQNLKAEQSEISLLHWKQTSNSSSTSTAPESNCSCQWAVYFRIRLPLLTHSCNRSSVNYQAKLPSLRKQTLDTHLRLSAKLLVVMLLTGLSRPLAYLQWISR